MTKFPFTRKGESDVQQGLIHTDVCESKSITARRGFSYNIMSIDEIDVSKQDLDLDRPD